jgi:hypothetical protein
MKQKKLPEFIKGKVLIDLFQSKMGRICTNWLFQGMCYMNRIEIIYKILLESVLVFAWWVIIFRNHTVIGWGVAWFFAHTTNWIINGQPIAMLRHLDWGKNEPHKFISILKSFYVRLHECHYLCRCRVILVVCLGEIILKHLI